MRFVMGNAFSASPGIALALDSVVSKKALGRLAAPAERDILASLG
jgi:hypothetical protein